MIWRPPPPPLPASFQHLQHIPRLPVCKLSPNTRYIHSWSAFCTCAGHHFCMSVHFCRHNDRSPLHGSPLKSQQVQEVLEVPRFTTRFRSLSRILIELPWLSKSAKWESQDWQTLISTSSTTVKSFVHNYKITFSFPVLFWAFNTKKTNSFPKITND